MYSRKKTKHQSTTNSAIKYQKKNVKATAPKPKVCDSNKDRTDDWDDKITEDFPGLQVQI